MTNYNNNELNKLVTQNLTLLSLCIFVITHFYPNQFSTVPFYIDSKPVLRINIKR